MLLKKKHVLILSLLILGVSCKQKSKNIMKTTKENSDLEVLVGTYTNDKSKGIYKLILNSETGEIKTSSLLAEIDNPSFLTISDDGKNVYAVQENEEGQVYSFGWNKDSTKLLKTSSISTNGMHPCYVSLKANQLAVGNYSSGTISYYKVTEEGKIDSSFQTKKHLGKGTFLPRQESPHAHCVQFYKDKFLYAVDLGIDKILAYPIENKTLKDQTIALKTDDGDGPRHLTFHPTKNVSYVTTEFTNAIIVSKINTETGIFNRIQKISMLPEKYAKESFAADIHITKDGKFLYASNRGHNSIAAYAIDTEGKLQFISHTDTVGNWPRNFALSPDNKFLLVANQFSNTITVFKRDQKNGTLTYTGYQKEISVPVFVKFL